MSGTNPPVEFESGVRVFCHLKSSEHAGTEKPVFHNTSPNVVTFDSPDEPVEDFAFDGVIDDSVPESDVYELVMGRLLAGLFVGKSSTVWNYDLEDQFRFLDSSSATGLVRLAAKDILRGIDDKPDFALFVASHQAYDDEIIDSLLQSSHLSTNAKGLTPPSLFQSCSGGGKQTYKDNITALRVQDYEMFEMLIKRASMARESDRRRPANGFSKLRTVFSLILHHVNSTTRAATLSYIHMIDLSSLGRDESEFGPLFNKTAFLKELALNLSVHPGHDLSEESGKVSCLASASLLSLCNTTIIITCSNLPLNRNETLRMLRGAASSMLQSELHHETSIPKVELAPIAPRVPQFGTQPEKPGPGANSSATSTPVSGSGKHQHPANVENSVDAAIFQNNRAAPNQISNELDLNQNGVKNIGPESRAREAMSILSGNASQSQQSEYHPPQISDKTPVSLNQALYQEFERGNAITADRSRNPGPRVNDQTPASRDKMLFSPGVSPDEPFRANRHTTSITVPEHNLFELNLRTLPPKNSNPYELSDSQMHGRRSFDGRSTPGTGFPTNVIKPTYNDMAEEIDRRDRKIASLESELLVLKMNELKAQHNESSKHFQFENALLRLSRKISEIERVNGELQRHMVSLQDAVAEKTSTITHLRQNLQDKQGMVIQETQGFEGKLRDLQVKLLCLENQHDMGTAGFSDDSSAYTTPRRF